MIKYVVPSYQRYDELLTLDYLKRVKVYVSEDDYPKYTENFDKQYFVKMPNEYQGKGKAVAMNWILNNEWTEDTDAIIMLDDDIVSGCVWSYSKSKVRLSEDEFYTVIENLVLLAKEWGCGMFAFGKGGQDRLMHNCMVPFKLHNTGSGQLMGFVRNDGIRFDEKLLTSEDMDIQLQEMQKYHKMLTVDRYYLDVKQWTNDGGYQSIRDGRETDKKYRDVLCAKWGNAVRVSKKQKAGVAYTVSVPLKGV